MRLLEVCPECGADIQYFELCTNPPIPVRRCTKCNWEWKGEPEETLRVPFRPEGYGSGATINIPAGSYTLKVPVINTLYVNI